MSGPASRLVCAGCGAEPARDDPYPFRCPNAGTGDVDHVLRRELDLGAVRFPTDDAEPNPFVRYRRLLHAYHVARDGGIGDEDFCALVRAARRPGRGDRRPRLRRDAVRPQRGAERPARLLAERRRLGEGRDRERLRARTRRGTSSASSSGSRWPSGSASTDPAARADLAIASCGNAALAAAVVAAAGGRRLRVFVPTDADPAVLRRLEELDTLITVCRRGRAPPAIRPSTRCCEALAAGALPFTCQGNLNGLAVEGGETLGWELAAAGGSGRPARRAGRRRRARERVHPRLRRGGRARRAQHGAAHRHRADRAAPGR